jgi:hypothetical protein
MRNINISGKLVLSLSARLLLKPVFLRGNTVSSEALLAPCGSARRTISLSIRRLAAAEEPAEARMNLTAQIATI